MCHELIKSISKCSPCYNLFITYGGGGGGRGGTYHIHGNVRMYMCNELRGNMARSTQFPIMITRSTIIYEIVSPGAAGSSIYI